MKVNSRCGTKRNKTNGELIKIKTTISSSHVDKCICASPSGDSSITESSCSGVGIASRSSNKQLKDDSWQNVRMLGLRE